MSEETKDQLIKLTHQLLESIAQGDWDTYEKLCDPSMTAFEPECRGHLVSGMEFHKFYFDNVSHRLAVNTTIVEPHVRMLGDDVAVVSFIRLQQRMSSDSIASTSRFEETRVWTKNNGRWIHVHFHRSDNGKE